ncbi:SRPBCC family protein [Rhizohabitans arisaemae]|uniref:SRPBCC family protein n=1 Tax=Rhizohabitans arisaemae TaxID=2720610 RepID=UPI0024B0734B|nr:SRPBCC family protein [Rhizohabitans arisaemae]
MSDIIQPRTPGDARVIGKVLVAVPPPVLFALLADPQEHPRLDGTEWVRGVIEGPERLELGSEFRMRMKGYSVTNTVVEFEENRLIAWRHSHRHVWRWEFREVPGGTEVTETFDYRAKRARFLVELFGLPKRAATSLEKTLTALRVRFG